MENPQDPSQGQAYYPLPSTVSVTTEPLPILGELPRTDVLPRPQPRRVQRRILAPALLFAATCLSTFIVGSHLKFDIVRRPDWPAGMSLVSVLGMWHDGMVYMLAVMGILLAHEMGHFLQAVRYGVPASLPWFVPMPIGPLGTMGAVIGMQGSQSNRKELFDIGISGPLAGLVVALPLTWIGIRDAVPFPMDVVASSTHFQDPLLFKALIWYLHPDLPAGQELQMNPLLMAGWVGMLITGLNMMPISQLDGGHVAYAVLGRRSYWLARAVMLAAIAFTFFAQVYTWVVMLLLVSLIGVYHPPTGDDRQPLGWARSLLGVASLAIPILCLAPNPIT